MPWLALCIPTDVVIATRPSLGINFRVQEIDMIKSIAPTALGGIMQMAWVTPDLDASLSQFGTLYGVPAFYQMEVDFPAVVFGESGNMTVRLALANVDNIQLEIIQPVGGGINRIYRDALPADGSHANVFHHVCVKVEGSLADWDAYVAKLGPDRPIVYIGDAGPEVRFLYTDDRAALGIYVEHIWRSAALDAAMDEAVPTFNSK